MNAIYAKKAILCIQMKRKYQNVKNSQILMINIKNFMEQKIMEMTFMQKWIFIFL